MNGLIYVNIMNAKKRTNSLAYLMPFHHASPRR